MEAAEEVRCRRPAPKGVSDSEELAVSLKRYPDTKPEFSDALAAGLQEAAEEVRCRRPAPKGADSEELAVSLKRYPDTKPEFLRNL